MTDINNIARQHLGVIVKCNDKLYVNGGKLKASITKVMGGIDSKISIAQIMTKYNLGYIFTVRDHSRKVVDIELSTYLANVRKYMLYLSLEDIAATPDIVILLNRSILQIMKVLSIMIGVMSWRIDLRLLSVVAKLRYGFLILTLPSVMESVQTNL